MKKNNFNRNTDRVFSNPRANSELETSLEILQFSADCYNEGCREGYKIGVKRGIITTVLCLCLYGGLMASFKKDKKKEEKEKES